MRHQNGLHNMHKSIKKFSHSGFISDDKHFPRLRNEYERALIEQMRDSGYVPVLDLGPYFSTKWEEDKYSFISTIYGIFVGKRKACQIQGVIIEGQQSKYIQLIK